jgi:3-hydroxybutyryl-CoA dehydratase
MQQASHQVILRMQGSLFASAAQALAAASTVKVNDDGFFTKRMTLDEVTKFAHCSGDLNPLHLDEETGRKSRFGQRIAHGMASAIMFGTVFAAAFPGSVYLSQNFQFIAPVFLNDDVTATVVVLKVVEQRKREKDELGAKKITCSTVCHVERNGSRVNVITGTAEVLVPAAATAKL